MATIYTGTYRNHSIRIDNSISQCKLYIDGKERDIIKGIKIREGANILRSTISDGNEDVIVEVIIETIILEKALFRKVWDYGYSIKINGDLFYSGLFNSLLQKKYGEKMQKGIAEGLGKMNLKKLKL